MPLAADAEKKTDPAETVRLQKTKQALEVADLGYERVGGPISRTNAFGAQVAGESIWLSVILLFMATVWRSSSTYGSVSSFREHGVSAQLWRCCITWRLPRAR